MATVIVTLKLMPESPEVDFVKILEDAKKLIEEFTSESEIKSEEEPIAFGLKALKITFVMDEELGGTETLEKQINEVEGVQSVETIDVRRAIG
jgi:elongation factor 1-beta